MTLGLWATKTLQWAAVVHLGMGVWMLSSPFIFPNSVSDLSAGALETIGGALGKEADEFSNSTFVETDVEFLADVQSRFLKNSSLPNLLLLVAFFTYKILHQFKFFTAALAFVASYLDRFLAYFTRGGNILSSVSRTLVVEVGPQELVETKTNPCVCVSVCYSFCPRSTMTTGSSHSTRRCPARP